MHDFGAVFQREERLAPLDRQAMAGGDHLVDGSQGLACEIVDTDADLAAGLDARPGVTRRNEGTPRHAKLVGGDGFGHGRAHDPHRGLALGFEPRLALDQKLTREFSQFIGGEGFLHVLGGAELQRLHGGLDGPVASDDHYVHIGAQVLHSLHHFDAAHLRHLHVREYEIVVVALYEPEGFRSGFHRVDVVTLQHQDAPEGIQDHRLVVNGKDARFGMGHFHAFEGLGLMREIQA